jgi:Spy/CpxP family protein refolding chaperone
MNYFDKSKFSGIIIIALFLLNLGTLTFMWVNRPPHPPPPEFIRDGNQPPPGNASDFLIHELKLSEAQQKDYEKLRDEHRAAMKKIHEDIGKSRDEMFSMLSSGNADTVKAATLAAKIGELEKQVQLTTFSHFAKVKALCDDTQKKKFDEIIGEVLKMMAPPPGNDGRMPPPGERRPPPPNGERK